jgi:hypothetical protein
MTVINTIEGLREITRTPDGIILSPHGPLGSGAWVLSDEAAEELLAMTEGLDNASPERSLGSVEVLTSIGRRSLEAVLRGNVLELRDPRKLSIVRWNVRRMDGIENLRAALADALAEKVLPDEQPPEDDDVVDEGELVALRSAAASGVAPKHSQPHLPARRR